MTLEDFQQFVAGTRVPPEDKLYRLKDSELCEPAELYTPEGAAND
jgi:hypothetical protein